MKKILICVDSYPRIQNTLYVITQNYRKYAITVLISENENLYKFFSLINERLFNNEIELVFYNLYRTDPRRSTSGGLKRILYIIPDIIRERRHLRGIYDRYLRKYSGCEVYIFNRGYMDFFIARKLRKKNSITYISSYPTEVTPVQYTPGSITELLRLAILKLVYGRGITMGSLPHISGFPHMSDSFLNKKIDIVISDEERDEMMRDFKLSQFNVFDTYKYRVIYFDQYLLDSPYIASKDTFRRELTAIFDVINRYFPAEEIAIKYHPDLDIDMTVKVVGDVIPSFIPAEFLYNDNVKVYIGAYSNSLANVEKGLAVSILDLISLKSEEDREALKEIIAGMSLSEVLFPKSLGEFEKILAGIKHD